MIGLLRNEVGKGSDHMERYYTAAQIGEILGGKSPRAVRQMIVRGDFGDTLQDGKQHLVPASGLEAYIKARTGPAEPYQRHFTITRPRRKIPEPQPLKA